MFGSFIRELRASRAMTQTELAEASGIEQPNISAIENGRRVPTVDTFHCLVESCGYQLAAIAGERTYVVSPDEVAHTEPPVEMTADEQRRAVIAALDLAETIVRSRR